MDLRSASPVLLAEFDRLAGPQVMQTPQKDDATGEWFVSQAVDVPLGSGSVEDTIVTRLSAQGGFLSSMVCKYAGHGTVIDVERIGGGLWLWLSWPTWDANGGVVGHDLCRVRYVDGATLTKADASVVDDFTTGYTSCALDHANDWIVVRESTGTADSYTLRRLSEFRAGTDVTHGFVGGINLQAEIMQGFTALEGILYRLVGTSTSANLIRAYDLAAGQEIYSLPVDCTNPDGTPLHGSREPEGLGLYVDPTGQPHITVGFSCGPRGKRTHRVYGYSTTPILLSPAVEALSHQAHLTTLAADEFMTWKSGWDQADDADNQLLYQRAGHVHTLLGAIRTGTARTLTGSNQQIGTLEHPLILPPPVNLQVQAADNTGVGVKLLLTADGLLHARRGAGTGTTLKAGTAVAFSLTWMA